LPRSYQDLEVSGRSASMTMVNGGVEMRVQGKDFRKTKGL
jgi:hypothetical protein